jgi:putative peptidoglycan lipid II flippase
VSAANDAENDASVVATQDALEDGEKSEDGYSTNTSVAKATASMSGLTALSRVTGFVRAWAMAITLGATFLSSSYQAANNLPNMFYELVAGGILSSLFIPLFMERLAKHGEEDARDFASTVFLMAMIGLGVVSLAGTIWPEPFVLTLIPKSSNLDPQAAIYMFRFFSIQMLIYGAGAIFTGILNSRRIFVPSAIGPVFNNVVVVATFGLYAVLVGAFHVGMPVAITVLAIGTTLGVVAQIGVQLPALRKTGFRFTAKLDFRNPAVRRMGVLAIPTVIYVVTNLIGLTFRYRFAFQAEIPGLQAGSGPSVLTLAWMWYQLPYGIFAVALATAFLPELATAAHKADWAGFSERFGRGLRATGLLIIPAAALLIALSVPIVTAYRFGAFTAAAVAPTAQVLSVWALGLFSFAGYMFVLRSFYATQDARTPMLTNILATLLQVTLYWALTQGVGAWRGIGLVGIPAGDAIAYTAHFALLAWLLRRKVGPLQFGRTFSSLGRTLVAAVGGAAVAWAVVRFTPALSESRFGFMLQLVLGGLVAIGVVWGLAAAMRIPEISVVSGLVKRIADRIRPKAA